MIRKKHQEIEWLEFLLLQEFPHVKHGVFLRSSNQSVKVVDGESFSVARCNEQKIAEMYSVKELVVGRQVHGVNIAIVGPEKFNVTECDGLITTEKKKALMIEHADCQAAIFYDPCKGRLAVVHCGWRGSVQNIYEKTVKRLAQLGSSPANLIVCISPSLGPRAAEFIHYKEELPESFQEFKKEGCFFDFWAISRFQLLQAGISDSHIEIAGICTYENKDDYFSYRRDKIKRGNATIAMFL